MHNIFESFKYNHSINIYIYMYIYIYIYIHIHHAYIHNYIIHDTVLLTKRITIAFNNMFVVSLYSTIMLCNISIEKQY